MRKQIIAEVFCCQYQAESFTNCNIVRHRFLVVARVTLLAMLRVNRGQRKSYVSAAVVASLALISLQIYARIPMLAAVIFGNWASKQALAGIVVGAMYSSDRVAGKDFREPLINSESFSYAGKMPERWTVHIKTPIAGKAQSNRCSQSIRVAHGLGPMSKASVVGLTRIGNAAMRRSELDSPALRHFNQQMLIHELIRGSLVDCFIGLAVIVPLGGPVLTG